MIIVQLRGGLGNQLFQYAAGRRLSVKNNTKLFLDITKLSTQSINKHEIFNLDKFNINAEIIESNLLNEFYSNNLLIKIIRKIKKIFNLEKYKRYFEKKMFRYDSSILNLCDNTFLWGGYWQSEKYFFDIKDIIKNELSLKNEISLKSRDTMNQIKQNLNTVSVHVRRGDYISDKKTNSFLGTCSLDYYINCIKILLEELVNINLFVFSDDFEWVKTNIRSDLFENPKLLNIYYVNHNNTDTAFEDMYLMSLCEHNIISNSSFSWWAAWLNNNINKKIFAPKNWIVDEKNNKLDIVPDSWRRI